MKKFIFIILITLFFILFKNSEVKAQTGTCILKQQNTTYEIETPFYFYEVIQESIYDDMLNNTISYHHTYSLIETKDNCLTINELTPTYEQPYKNNALSNKTKNYYFDSSLLIDSNSIYQKSLKKFKVPDIVIKDGFTITSTYISFDNLPPTIANDELNSIIIVNVNELTDINKIIDKITAYDENDGIVEVKTHEDNYTPNYTILGTYSITFSSSDNSGNTSYLTIKIKVVDTIRPTITGQTLINSYMSNPLTKEQIKATLTIKDNYDKNLTNIIISNDTYSNNLSNEGIFEITFLAYDLSNNESLPFTVKIKILDDIAPIISGETSYKVTLKNLLNTSTIMSQLTTKDNVDTSPTIEIEKDTYTPNYYKIGVYQISFISKDKNNNSSNPFTVNIIVEDKESPIFYISQKFIGTDVTNQIPIEKLINLVNEINNIKENQLENLTVLEDNYTPNSTKEGTYTLKIKYEYEDSKTIILESNIVVSSFKTNEKENKNTPRKTFWSVLKNFLKKIFNFIKKTYIKFKKLI